MSILTDIVAGFTPENELALLFFEMADSEHELTLLMAKLEDLVKQRIDYSVFRGTVSSVILLRLMPQNAREAVLMLSEIGLNDLMVLYPRPKK